MYCGIDVSNKININKDKKEEINSCKEYLEIQSINYLEMTDHQEVSNNLNLDPVAKLNYEAAVNMGR